MRSELVGRGGLDGWTSGWVVVRAVAEIGESWGEVVRGAARGAKSRTWIGGEVVGFELGIGEVEGRMSRKAVVAAKAVSWLPL